MLVTPKTNRADYTEDAHHQDENEVTVIRASLVVVLVHALKTNG